MSVLSEIFDLSADSGEALVDRMLDDGILKDIPLLSSALAVARISRTISDRIFYSKVKNMLLHVGQVDAQTRSAFRRRMQDEPDYAKKVGESLVLICDDLDDLAKAEMLGVVFRSHLSSGIELDTFRRLATAINAGYIDDLLCFAISGSDPVGLIDPYMFRLTHTGLTVQDATLRETPREPTVKTNCDVTDLGTAFLRAVGTHYESRKAELSKLRGR